MIFLGIDPGAGGGLADLGHGTGVIPGTVLRMVTIAMPKTERDVWEWFNSRGPCDCESDVFAVIEHVHSMPGQGVSSTFKFGMSYGALRMALIAAEIPFEAVAPGVWQREFGLIGKKGESKVQKKNRNKAKAQELWPAVKVTHATADAMLLSEYARRLHAKRKAT